MWERLSIFNAYYLPGGGNEKLYPEISPVNTFRIVFNHYFDTNFEILKDESYYSLIKRPYQIENVTHRALRESQAK